MQAFPRHSFDPQYTDDVRLLLAKYPDGQATFVRYATSETKRLFTSVQVATAGSVHPVNCSPPIGDDQAAAIDSLVRNYNERNLEQTAPHRGELETQNERRGPDQGNFLSCRDLDFLFSRYGREQSPGVREISHMGTTYQWSSGDATLTVENAKERRATDLRNTACVEPFLASVVRGQEVAYAGYRAQRLARDISSHFIPSTEPNDRQRGAIASIGESLAASLWHTPAGPSETLSAQRPQCRSLGDAVAQTFLSHRGLRLDTDQCQRLDALAEDGLLNDAALAEIGLNGTHDELDAYLKRLEAIQATLRDQRGGEISEQHVRDELDISELNLDPRFIESIGRLVREGRLDPRVIVNDIRTLSVMIETNNPTLDKRLEAFSELVHHAEHVRERERDHVLTHSR